MYNDALIVSLKESIRQNEEAIAAPRSGNVNDIIARILRDEESRKTIEEAKRLLKALEG